MRPGQGAAPIRLSIALAVLAAASCGGDDDAGSVDGGPGADASGRADAGGFTGTQPSKRSDIASVVDPATGALVIFGGDEGPIVDQTPMPVYRSDTWALDPRAGWSEITGGAAPSTRGRYAVAHDPSNERMLLFGGRFRAAQTTGNYTLLDDLWAFDYAEQRWDVLDSGGSGPAPRYFAAAAFDPTAATLYVYGGDVNPAALGVTPATDVWSYTGGSWDQVLTAGNGPSGRLYVAYTYDATRNRLVVFGGQVGDFVTPSFNDLYALDLELGVWSRIHDGAGTAPSGRFSAAMTYDAAGDRYVVFGGHADLGVVNDVWAFTPGAGAWELLHGGDSFTGAALGCLGNPAEIPANYVDQDLAAPERRSTPAFGNRDGVLWVFGGESDCSDHLDDTWQFDLSSRTWTEMQAARSGESCARRNDACTCLCL